MKIYAQLYSRCLSTATWTHYSIHSRPKYSTKKSTQKQCYKMFCKCKTSLYFKIGAGLIYSLVRMSFCTVSYYQETWAAHDTQL